MLLSDASFRPKAVVMRGFPFFPQSSGLPAWPNCAGCKFEGSAVRGPISLNELKRTVRKRKTRPGGQPDGSSHMGAWGGWALAPNTASMGRENRSHIYWSPQGRRTFKRPAVFLTFLAGFCRALSIEVASGSRQENALNQEPRALVSSRSRRNRPWPEIIARRGDWSRQRSICRRPSPPQAGSRL